MGNAAVTQKAPMDPDYNGSRAAQLTALVTGGTLTGDGDTGKAAKAIYEVAAAEGIGAGNEAEICLPLGRDMAIRMKDVVARMEHTMDVFGDVCNNVYVEK